MRTLEQAARPEATARALVACVGVGRTFGRGDVAVVAVHGATCEVTPTSRIAVVGPSGSGKSTLLHLMAGLDVPTSGSVTWPRWPAGPFHDPTRVGVVFQGLSLVPHLDASENVALPLLLQGMEPDLARERALESLALVGMSTLGDRLPGQLSGGQSQRVAVARVVASRPGLIVADEPTGQLDRTMGERVVDVLLDAADHVGAGLVVATHDPAVSARLHEVWRMDDGELETHR